MARIEMDAAAIAAAGADDGEAFYALGVMYASGRSVEPDFVAAHKWFNVAIVRGCRGAAARRAELALEMTREQIASAQREARLFLTRH